MNALFSGNVRPWTQHEDYARVIREAAKRPAGTLLPDSFLSEEDLDLANLSEQELDAVWEAWFEAAQSTNDANADRYSHACFGDYAPYPVGPKKPPTAL